MSEVMSGINFLLIPHVAALMGDTHANFARKKISYPGCYPAGNQHMVVCYDAPRIKMVI
jgi:hypothetical protein